MVDGKGRGGLRLFIAFEVPQERKRSVEEAIEPLRGALPGIRWVPRSNWHVTVNFLGEVPKERFDELKMVVAATVGAIKPGAVHLAGIGAFPSLANAKVLWAGIEQESGTAGLLAESLGDALGQAGFRQEHRRYHPHLTLARISPPGSLEGLISDDISDRLDPEPFVLEDVVVFRSHLSPKGTTYEDVARVRLSGND